jgi:hypothetical protein
MAHDMKLLLIHHHATTLSSFSPLSVPFHSDCIDSSQHHALQIMTIITTNSQIETQLWPSKVWHSNGAFGYHVMLGHNFTDRWLLTS